MSRSRQSFVVNSTPARAASANVELARYRNELPRVGDRLDAGDYRHVDADSPSPVHEFAERPRREDHLGDDVVGSRVHLCFQVTQVVGKVRRLVVLFRVPGNADAEVGCRRVVELLQVMTAVHSGNLGRQFRGEPMAGRLGNELLLPRRRVATQDEQVLEAQVLQVNNRILGLVLVEPAADDVRHGLDLVPVVNGRADADRARVLAPRNLPGQARTHVFVHNPLLVIGNGDERRFERQQLVDRGEQLGNRPPLFWRGDLD